MKRPKPVSREQPYPVSLVTQARLGLLSGLNTKKPADYICGECYTYNDEIMPVDQVFKCLKCGSKNLIHKGSPASLSGQYEIELTFRQLRQEKGNLMDALSLSNLKSPIDFRREVESYKRSIVQSMLIPDKVENPVERDAAIQILAESSVATGLNPFTRQIMIISLGKDKWALFVGVHGARVIAERHCLLNGEYFGLDRRVTPYTVDEIIGGWMNKCPNCYGSGQETTWSNGRPSGKKPCTRCEGKKFLDPLDIMTGYVNLYYTASAKATAAFNHDPEPFESVGIVYPWEAWPSSWTPSMLLYKRCVKHGLWSNFQHALTIQTSSGLHVPVRIVEGDTVTQRDMDDVEEALVEPFTINLEKEAVTSDDIEKAQAYIEYLGMGHTSTGNRITDKIPSMIFGDGFGWVDLTPLALHNLMSFISKASTLSDMEKTGSVSKTSVSTLFRGSGVDLKDEPNDITRYRTLLREVCGQKTQNNEVWN